MLLELPLSKKDDVDTLKSMGISAEHIDNDMIRLVALLKKATSGDIQAIKYIDDVMGESPYLQIKKEELKIKQREITLKEQLTTGDTELEDLSDIEKEVFGND